MDRLTLRRPDDWHLHLRDGAMLAAVLPDTAAVMGRGIAMPNLVPPVRTTAEAAAYRERILSARPAGSDFTPLMTAYLTDDTDPDDLAAGFETGVLTAVKLYPAGATTNSASGVTDIDALTPVLERLAELGMPLLVHGEVTDAHVDIFDREAVFIEQILAPLVVRHPRLKVVLEHVTTAEAVAFVAEHAPQVAATVTPQHLLANRNDLLVGGVKPHFYCLPVLKRARHQQALVDAVCSGHPAFFLGTDSAPHAVGRKESACGCAGCYTAPVALQLYAEVFDANDALDKLEGFASLNGPAFYGLPPNNDHVTLVRRPGSRVPDRLDVDGLTDGVQPFLAGRPLAWQIAENAPHASEMS